MMPQTRLFKLNVNNDYSGKGVEWNGPKSPVSFPVVFCEKKSSISLKMAILMWMFIS